MRVQELRGWAPVTRIPQSPTHVLGVLNLRGSIVPIIDLRVRFSFEQAQFTPLTVIVVLSVMSSSGRREVGTGRRWGLGCRGHRRRGPEGDTEPWVAR